MNNIAEYVGLDGISECNLASIVAGSTGVDDISVELGGVGRIGSIGVVELETTPSSSNLFGENGRSAAANDVDLQLIFSRLECIAGGFLESDGGQCAKDNNPGRVGTEVVKREEGLIENGIILTFGCGST